MNNQLKYFYQKKHVIDKIETPQNIEKNFTNEKCLDINKLSGSKHYTKPLIKNIKVENIKEDINISNKIRSGFTRLDNPEFQKEKESYVNTRFQFLTKNYQDPNKLVLPFPRGGEMTREKYYKNFKK